MQLRALCLALMLCPLAAAAGEYRWEVPEMIRHVEVPELLQANGLDVRLAAAVSKRRPEALAQYYMDEFEKAGLYVPPAAHQAQVTVYPALTGLDTRNLVSYTVILQPNADKSTTVVFGMTNLKKGLTGDTGDDFAPVFPGAQGVFRTRAEAMRSISFRVSASPDEVRGYYADLLGPQGFRERAPGEFVRPGERIRLFTHSEQAGGELQVILNHSSTDAHDALVDDPELSPVLRQTAGDRPKLEVQERRK